MKLLIITQKVDKDDPILGFFHEWIAEFSKRFESIIVICLEMGKHDLPTNVKVLSLGKEEMRSSRLLVQLSRLSYLRRFYSFVWKHRNEYDAVFVHMNQEYILAAGWLWCLFGKKIYMWRNHYSGNILTDVASSFCAKVFCTSKFSYTAKYKKTSIMPVGIDTNVFGPVNGVARVPNSILFIGRIAPSKNISLILSALEQSKTASNSQVSIYGDPIQRDIEYYEQMKLLAVQKGLEDRVVFLKGIPNSKTPELYSTHDICVNASRSGMLDKTILESMLCGALPLISNKDMRGQIDERFIFKEGDHEDMANKLVGLLGLSEKEKDRYRSELRKYAEEHHSLFKLAKMLSEEVVR